MKLSETSRTVLRGVITIYWPLPCFYRVAGLLLLARSVSILAASEYKKGNHRNLLIRII
jgi:hypothetical protein